MPSKSEMDGRKVICFTELTGNEIVIVATSYTDEIWECLKKEKIDIKNFIFYCKCKNVDCKTNLDLAKQILSPKNLQIYLKNYGAYDCSFLQKI